jgi:SPP1 gp7 family putative phage head morphogenesis protein
MKMATADKRAREAAMRYAHRQERERAFCIARTELASAYNHGAYNATKDAQEKGYIGDCKKTWLTADDERVCPICGGLDGESVNMDAKFSIDVDLPPAHPHCRCGVAFEEVTKPLLTNLANNDIMNIGEGKFNGKIGDSDDMTTITEIKPIDFNDEETILKEINDFCDKYAHADIEQVLVISPNGNAYSLTGSEKEVNHELIGKEALKNSIGIHNHPVEPGKDKSDSFSFKDIKSSNIYGEGKQYLVSGTRRDAYEFTEYYPVDEIETIWDKARNDAFDKHWNDETIVEFEQQDILRELGKYLKGFKYYEYF